MFRQFHVALRTMDMWFIEVKHANYGQTKVKDG